MKKVYDDDQEECNFFLQDLRCTNHTNNIQQYEKIYFTHLMGHQQDLIYFSHQFHQSHQVNNQVISSDLPEDENDIEIQHHLINNFQQKIQIPYQKDLSQAYFYQSQKNLHSYQNQQIKSLKQQSKSSLFQNHNEIDTQKSTKKNYELSRKWINKMNNIMQEKSINEFSTKHNRNMAKFFVRIFSKHIKNYTNLSNDSNKQIELKQMKQKLNKIQDKKSICLKDLQYLFGSQRSRLSREYLFRILREQLNKQIIKSQDIKNKNAYILCSKVYRLRCLSRYLVSRLQSR